MTPDLATYDLILVNTSAGKDSLAMLDLICTPLLAESAERPESRAPESCPLPT